MYAHLSPKRAGHRLDDHLTCVAQLAREFASKFGCGQLGYLVGLYHDLGKADPNFQRYLQGKLTRHEGGHAYPSAFAKYSELKQLACAVMGHHAGMPDFETGCEKLRFMEQDGLPALLDIQSFAGTLPLVQKLTWPEWAPRQSLSREFLIRMVFSCLVDADRLDTEFYSNPDLRANWKPYPPLSDYATRLADAMKEVKERARAKSSPITLEVREEVLDRCRAAAKLERGFFRLTVPTGGGKTLSGLSFGLDHAISHRLDRVITAIPYTSIIDQTADVYRQIFDADSFLEHHSAETFSRLEEAHAEQSHLSDLINLQRREAAVQNWDVPLVLTTNVQLFESLLSHRPSRCRKLHNVARSVILLDEVQTLPPHVLPTVLNVLKELVRNYECSVVFCTATQPDYSAILEGTDIESVEIVPEYPEHFRLLKRVDFRYQPEPMKGEEFLEEFTREDQILAVLNTKRVAVELSERAEAMCEPGTFFHLSTNLCGFDRRRIIREVQGRLASGQPVRLLSTQVIETGVDVDFPVVMRAAGPLDGIIQAAGRCNRGGLSDRGRVVIFHLEGETMPAGPYSVAYEATKWLLNLGIEIDSEEAGRGYWKQLYRDANTGQGRHDYNALRAELHFKTVGDRFKFIEEEEISVIVEHPQMPDGLLDRWGEMSPRRWFREVQPFLVSVRPKQLVQLKSNGLVASHDSGLMKLFTSAYSPTLGIRTHVDPDSLLI